MVLVAQPSRVYTYDTNASPVATATLDRYEPARLPAAAYEGVWEDTPAFDIAQTRVVYVLSARTRLLSSNVAVDDKTFPFVTFGTSLHVASGGGLVEHLLEEDRRALLGVVGAPASQWLTNPIRWTIELVSATKNVLGSKVHVLLLDRAFGAAHGEDIAGSVSERYESEVLLALRKALSIEDAFLSRSIWVISYIAVLTMLVAAAHGWAPRTLTHHLNLGLLRTSYPAALGVAAVVAATSFLARAIPAMALGRRDQETTLRCLLMVRGKTRALATAVAVLTLGAILFLLLAFRSA